MALKQNITTVSGVSVEYHRISKAEVDYTKREATVSIESYFDDKKRDEEKSELAEYNSNQKQRETLTAELDALISNPTEENEARRIELTEKINALPSMATPEPDSRKVFESQVTMPFPTGTDFTLNYAYTYLKENVYTSSQDC